MKRHLLKEKTICFSIRIVHLYMYLATKRREYVISKQVLRSGTSVGAMVREAEYSESPRDFIHKLAIAQKECNETLYWFELLNKTDFINDEEYRSISNDAVEILKIITSSILTVKRRLFVRRKAD